MICVYSADCKDFSTNGDGPAVPNLTIEKCLTFGGFAATPSETDGLLADWNDEDALRR